jgi:uncharacterized protein
MDMDVLKIFAYIIIFCYLGTAFLLFLFQTKLIFYPGKLSKDFTFKLDSQCEEIFLTTVDDEQINGLFLRGHRPEVILYFHGNAGDLSGWQFVTEDFTRYGYSILIIDYRGYGKSSGVISEKGFYNDAEAAYHFLVSKKGFTPQSIIVYGRSIGSGVAVEVASKHLIRGLVLESPCASLSQLVREKFPLLLPAFYLKYKFNNFGKINHVKSPVIFIHGKNDSLIPSAHTEKLFKKFEGKKQKVIIQRGQHNDLTYFKEYHQILSKDLPEFLHTQES